MEQMLCGILRHKKHTDVQIISDAFRQYAACKEKTL